MTIYSHSPNDLTWGDIRGELPWGHLSSNRCEHWLPNPDPAEVAICETRCPLYLEDGGDCNPKDERCPFYRKRHKQQQMAKVSYRARQGWERAVDEAAARIRAEMEAR